jgi:hypothetical protein
LGIVFFFSFINYFEFCFLGLASWEVRFILSCFFGSVSGKLKDLLALEELFCYPPRHIIAKGNVSEDKEQSNLNCTTVFVLCTVNKPNTQLTEEETERKNKPYL